MDFSATRCKFQDIENFRHLYLQENNFQIRYNACHERNWSDSWLLRVDGIPAGYASVKGKDNLNDRDAVFEFYPILPFRKYRRQLFESLLRESKAQFIECQSNDSILSSMIYECADNIFSDVVLFRENIITDIKNPGVVFRQRIEGEGVFAHAVEPVGDYILEISGEIIATGGFLLHYNYPFADLYMEVREDMRRKGYASYLLQEVKKECYLHGRVPAARCSVENKGSSGALIRAGMEISGYMLTGTVRK